MRPALNSLVLSLKESATLAINLKTLELRRRVPSRDCSGSRHPGADDVNVEIGY